MTERFYSPGKKKILCALIIFIVIFILFFNFIIYSSCPAVLQCSEAELMTNPLCTQTCTTNINFVLLVAIILISYLIPAAIIHHHNR
jgi:hypothetical protein